MTDDVTRSEFNGALDGIRREIRAMGESVGRDLQRLTKQMEDFISGRVSEAKALGQLQSDVENLKEWKEGAINSIRTLQVGLVITVVGAILTALLAIAIKAPR